MFFYAEAPEVDGKWRILNPDGKSMGKDADLLARYFLPDWKPVNRPDWPLFLDEFQRTHKQIAHLSLFRARQRRHYIGDGEERFNKKEWRPGELAKPVIACMRAFLNGCAAIPLHHTSSIGVAAISRARSRWSTTWSPPAFCRPMSAQRCR